LITGGKRGEYRGGWSCLGGAGLPRPVEGKGVFGFPELSFGVPGFKFRGFGPWRTGCFGELVLNFLCMILSTND